MNNMPLESGTESVWDYPRPPRLEPSLRPVRIARGPEVLARTSAALRILETSHPPVYYLPPTCFIAGLLQPSASRQSFCEFKGLASYWNLRLAEGTVLRDVGWSYDRPSQGFEALTGHIALYASRLVAAGIDCFVGDERVEPQEGDFYGGWITRELRGPFKGAPGTRFW
jgi:uncharacterized protein (DUF427 family)